LAQTRFRVLLAVEYAAVRLLFGLLRILPRPVATSAAQLFTKGLDFALPKLRRVGILNLATAFPSLSSTERYRIVDGVFRSIARIMVAVAKFPDIHKEKTGSWIRYEGLENYALAKSKGKGILVATAHLGNWELSAFTHALMTEPMGVMVRPLDNPLVDEFIEARRALSGNTVIGKREAARTVIRMLRENCAVGMLIDQNSAASEGVFVKMFGTLACANAGFARLAARTGATVIPGFALWEEQSQTYVLRFYPEIPMTGDTQADTQALHSAFEEVIRKYPDQWMWIHRRWKTRPAGEAPLY
jgi:Kdo2-lipid IVA lauroyltransferase/acyltransferase